MNNKSENFKRLAEKRVTGCVKNIRLIGNLANKNNYEFTDEQAKKIIATLEVEMKSLKNRFKQGMESTNYTFKLDDE